MTGRVKAGGERLVGHLSWRLRRKSQLVLLGRGGLPSFEGGREGKARGEGALYGREGGREGGGRV